jgi:threonine synthase
MHYYSLHHKSAEVSFKDALIKGIAPDKGLYFPIKINPLDPSFFKHIKKYSNQEIAFQTIKQFVGNDIPETVLKDIINDTLSFDFPLVSLSEDISVLELFHGPTMAFKDVGARFMARCLGYFAKKDKKQSNEVTVLVATSGDTGGAVANGFLGIKGVRVVILYPSNKVSAVQEKQLTTLGQNITALEVDCTFDDCQEMVKQAFLDQDIINKRHLTSANSINIARWLPQLFYFIFAYKQVEDQAKPIVFSVPSGNFGNICAGLVAHRLGLPVSHFIASVNSNDVIPDYMRTSEYKPKSSVATISNAMDVGNPSNFIRIRELFNNDFKKLSAFISSYSFSDPKTIGAMKHLYDSYKYIADPHGAVGYLGLVEYLKTNPNLQAIFLETAHPVKFLEIVENTIGEKIPLPKQIAAIINKEKSSIFIKNYSEFKDYLMNS